MNRVIVLMLLATAFGSSQEPAPIRPSPAFLHHLDSLTSPLSRDTVRLYFRRDSISRLGREIDRRFYAEVRAWYPTLGEFPQDRDLFGIARVSLGGGTSGYIVRVPSQYSPSRIDIWPFDPQSRTLGPPLRAADGFGDGAWHFQMDAWLVDLNGDGLRDLVQRRRDWWMDDETDKESESDSLFVIRRMAGQFQPRRLSADSLLRRRFDIPDWKAL